jgi:N-ethylmaleimide reductase
MHKYFTIKYNHMLNTHLFSSYQLGNLSLQNRIVMAPMTRSRATGNIPNSLMAKYYSQRSGAGLIITEATSPSPNGLGYANIPGIFNEEQVGGWKLITRAVHKNGGKIFVQLMHTGRIGHPLNLPMGAMLLAPSPLRATGKIGTGEGPQAFPVPQEMRISDIKAAQKEFVEAARNAIEAGFDGVELHAANGYLMEQFLSPSTNIRSDEYGGSIENRAKFVLETVVAVTAAIGADKVGIRLSPFSRVNDMGHYDEISETYIYLAEKLNETGILYLHLLDNQDPVIPLSLKKQIGKKFTQTLILAGGYHKETAAEDIRSGLANLIAFGKPFINNPDFVTRLRNNWSLSENLDTTTLYGGTEKGYIDYQPYQDQAIAV